MTTATRVVTEFQREYRFLSNYYPHPVWHAGQLYSTNEHAFQAAKTTDSNQRKWITTAGSPGEAKRRGRAVMLRTGWTEHLRYTVMEQLIAIKFAPATELAQRLVATGDAILIEGNNWHDNLWGVCSCGCTPGANLLGWMLMRQRALVVGYL
jgi:ribA/ribD-fused uncharacterized protein